MALFPYNLRNNRLFSSELPYLFEPPEAFAPAPGEVPYSLDPSSAFEPSADAVSARPVSQFTPADQPSQWAPTWSTPLPMYGEPNGFRLPTIRQGDIGFVIPQDVDESIWELDRANVRYLPRYPGDSGDAFGLPPTVHFGWLTSDRSPYSWVGSKGPSDVTFMPGPDDNSFSVKIKTADKEGTVVPYVLQGNEYVPQMDQAQQVHWDTNQGLGLKDLIAPLAVLTAPLWGPALLSTAGNALSSLFSGGAGASAGAGAGAAAGGAGAGAAAGGAAGGLPAALGGVEGVISGALAGPDLTLGLGTGLAGTEFAGMLPAAVPGALAGAGAGTLGTLAGAEASAAPAVAAGTAGAASSAAPAVAAGTAGAASSAAPAVAAGAAGAAAGAAGTSLLSSLLPNLIPGLIRVGTGLYQDRTARQGQENMLRAQLEAAGAFREAGQQYAAGLRGLIPELRDAFQYRPAHVDTGFATTAIDPATGQVRTTLAAPYQAARDQYLSAASNIMQQAAGFDPQEFARQRYAAAQSLLAPQDELARQSLMQDLANKGGFGLSLNTPAAGGGTVATNPYLSTFLNAQNQRNAQMAFDALREGESYLDNLLNRQRGMFGAATGVDALRAGALDAAAQFGNIFNDARQRGAVATTGMAGRALEAERNAVQDYIKAVLGARESNIATNTAASGARASLFGDVLSGVLTNDDLWKWLFG